MLRLRLLGTLALEDADGRTVFVNSKPGLLLAVLAATNGQRAPRGHLADLIWSGKDRERARASLRQAIHHLARLSLDFPWTLTNGTSVSTRRGSGSICGISMPPWRSADSRMHLPFMVARS